MTSHITPSQKIYLADSKILHAGRGVFAATDISEGEVIEDCPVLALPEKEYLTFKTTQLRNYYFIWGDENKQAALCLGYGTLYNHSYEPNASYLKHPEEKVIVFIALKHIAKDEEITVNYNYGDPDDKSKLWIEDVPGPEMS